MEIPDPERRKRLAEPRRKWQHLLNLRTRRPPTVGTPDHPQDGTQVSICSLSGVIGSPVNTGQSQMKLATTSPT